jgi:uncharacterized protein (DUF1697 family)
MVSVVFLKGVNVGGHRNFRPSLLASEMANFGVISVGAAGTFVVRKPISEAALRCEFQRRLPFATEAMICPGSEILGLPSAKCFADELSGREIVRFVSILAQVPRTSLRLPLELPAGKDWLVRIVAIRRRFAFGVYRRTLRTIGLLSQLEKHLGESVTNRNWNTFSKLIDILKAKTQQDDSKAAVLPKRNLRSLT